MKSNKQLELEFKTRKCPSCKSKKICFYTRGSTRYKPINNNYWGLCPKCFQEWDTKIKWK